MRDQQEQRALGRLLDQFEQRVGAGAVEVVGAIDDGDAPAAGSRSLMKGVDDLAHIVDADLGEEFFGFFVPASPQRKHVRERHRGDPPRRRRLSGHEQGLGPLNLRRRRVGMGQQEAREPPGQSCLADALEAAQNPCLRHSVLAVRRQQGLLRRRMAEKRQRLARVGRVLEPVAFRRGGGLPAHCACTAGARKRASTSRQIACETSSFGASASTTQQRSASLEAMSRKASRSPS